jgi:hypothetical protein
MHLILTLTYVLTHTGITVFAESPESCDITTSTSIGANVSTNDPDDMVWRFASALWDPIDLKSL